MCSTLTAIITPGKGSETYKCLNLISILVKLESFFVCTKYLFSYFFKVFNSSLGDVLPQFVRISMCVYICPCVYSSLSPLTHIYIYTETRGS